MRRLMVVAVLGFAANLAPLLAQATPVYHPMGANLTYGAVSNGQSIMSDITNPAAGAAALQQEGSQYRFGIISTIGAGVEFGDVADLYNALDTLSNTYSGLNITNTSSLNSIATEVDTAISAANSAMRNIADNGYAKGFATMSLPLMPIVVSNKALGGSLVLDVNGSLEYKAYALQENINFSTALLNDATLVAVGGGTQTVGDITVDTTTATPTFTMQNDSSVVTKAAKTVEVALGYSRPMMKTEDATLYAGLRGRYYQVGLSRFVQRMFDLTDSKNLFDAARNADFTSDTGFGIDIGALWASKHYRLGATLTNLNEPEFEFAAVDFSGFSNPNGSVAQQLRSDTKYTMEKQMSLEAAVYTKSRNWVFSTGYDANAIEDALGDEYQWATVSVAYATDTWWLPGIRAGWRKNLAGTEIEYYSFGTTIMMVNLDVAWSTDDVTIEGETVPRGAMFNLGLEMSF